MPTDFTTLATDLSSCSCEPMCGDIFPISAEVGHQANKVSRKPEHIRGSTNGAASKSGIPGDVGDSPTLMTGGNLSPVSQTFSFLDSRLHS